MDGRPRPSLTGALLNKPQNLRSSVSMFIEDSRVTAVANADVGPSSQLRASCPPTSFYSVTSYTSSSSSSSGLPPVGSGGGGGGRASWNLRPTFCQISTTLPDPTSPGVVLRPRACSSSPVRFPRSGKRDSREIIHNIIREVEETSPPPQMRQPPPPSTVRRRTTLNVEPVLSFIDVKEDLPPLHLRGLREDRAYTSVNLTLRSPTNPLGGGPVLTTSGGGEFSTGAGGGSVNVVNTVVDVDGGGATFHHVHHSGGGTTAGELHHHLGSHPATNLRYSTYSNSRDGFEAQVQIQFGPGGGTFTASRRRNHNISIVRQMNSDLLSAQTERKEKLRTTIYDRRRLLATLQTEIVQLRSQLQLRTSFSEVHENLEKLKQENQRLRIECDFMAREVDLYQNGSVPLGETDEEFYQGINPGQSVDCLFGITNNRRKIHGPPPRPPPPKFLQSPTQNVGEPGSAGGAGAGEYGGNNNDGEWKCSMCTFQNHRDLDFCEQCQMVRTKPLGHHPQTQQSPHSHHLPHHGPSREQNIRIRVVRRNNQSHQRPHPDEESHQRQEQSQRRRVVHSWVM